MEARAALFPRGSRAPGGAKRLLSRLPRRSSQGERAMTLAFAGGAVRRRSSPSASSIDDPAEAPSVLYVLPVALVAIRFGALGGVIAADVRARALRRRECVNEEGAGVARLPDARNRVLRARRPARQLLDAAAQHVRDRAAAASSSSRRSSTTAPRSSTSRTARGSTSSSTGSSRSCSASSTATRSARPTATCSRATWRTPSAPTTGGS